MNIGDLFFAFRGQSEQLIADAQAAGIQAGGTLGQSISTSLKRHSRLIAGSLGAAVGGFATQGMNDFARFDDQMREVFSIMPGITKDAMERMKGDVLSVSTEFGILTDELIPALGTAIGSGIPEENALDFMRTAAKAAKAGAADADSAVKVLAATINAYQMDVADAEDVSNDMFNAIDKGVLSMDELAAGMANVMPNAAAMGLTFKETLAPITAMTLQGTPTANAITQVNAALVTLQRTTPQMNQILKALGFETGQAAIDALGFQGALEAIRAEADRLGVPMIKVTGRMEGASAILQLTGQNAARANEILGTFEDTAGRVDAAFETMEGGIGGAARRLGAQVRAIGIQVGQEMAAFGPLFIAFGPQIGRLLGAAFGGAFGLLATQLPRLMGPVLAKMGAVIAGSQLGTSLATSLSNGLTTGPIMGRLNAIGGKWGKVLGVGAAAALGTIILAELAELHRIQGENARQAMKVDADLQKLLDEGVDRGRAQQMLADLKATKYGIGEVQGAIVSLGDLGEGNVLGSVFDVAFGDNPAETANEAIRTLERYLASDLPETLVPAATQGGEAVGQAVSDGIAQGATEGAKAQLPVVSLIQKGVQRVKAIVMDSIPAWRRLDQALADVAIGGLKDLEAKARTTDRTWKRLIETGDRNKQAIRELNKEIGRWERRYTRAVKNNDSEAAAFASAQLTRLTGERDARQDVVDEVRAQRTALNRLPKKTTTTVNVVGESSLDRVILKIRGLTSGEAVVRIDGQVYGGVGGRASGGPVDAGKPYWVGEMGRELIVPRTDSYVVSAHESRGAGGDTFNVTNNGMPLQAKTPRELVQEMRRAARVGLMTPARRRGWEPS